MSPGLFDFQVNGFAGVDFQRDDWTDPALHAAFSAMHRHGLARCFVTLITAPVDDLCHRLARFEQMRQRDPLIGRMLAGYHLEGPWLSCEPGYIGAHPLQHTRDPRPLDFDRLQSAANGHVRLVTLAPELPGSAEFIAHLRATGVHVSLGHTNAGEQHIDDAIRAGARFCTHLGNATPSLLPRHDNIIQRLLARDELIACFIPDGVHLPSFVLRTFVKAKGVDRVLFTTDAMSAAAAAPGRYTLGPLEVAVGSDGVARQPNAAAFAGSTLTPDEGVRRVSRYLDLPLSTAEHIWSAAAESAFGLRYSLTAA